MISTTNGTYCETFTFKRSKGLQADAMERVLQAPKRMSEKPKPVVLGLGIDKILPVVASSYDITHTGILNAHERTRRACRARTMLTGILSSMEGLKNHQIKDLTGFSDSVVCTCIVRHIELLRTNDKYQEKHKEIVALLNSI